jgi:hypothetical protein
MAQAIELEEEFTVEELTAYEKLKKEIDDKFIYGYGVHGKINKKDPGYTSNDRSIVSEFRCPSKKRRDKKAYKICLKKYKSIMAGNVQTLQFGDVICKLGALTSSAYYSIFLKEKFLFKIRVSDHWLSKQNCLPAYVINDYPIYFLTKEIVVAFIEEYNSLTPDELEDLSCIRKMKF